MFLMAPWNKTVSYGETMRAEMKAREAAIRNFFQNVDVALRAAADTQTTAVAKWEVRGLGGLGSCRVSISLMVINTLMIHGLVTSFNCCSI